MKTLPINTEAFFKRSVNVAEHYGFRSIDDLRKEARAKGTNVLGLQKYKNSEPALEQQTFQNTLKQYTETTKLSKDQPIMFYTPSLVAPSGAPAARVSALTLSTVGTNDPLVEVILLKSAMSILEELGIKDYTLNINSIGDNDSSARFLREASARIRGRMDELPEKFADAMRSNPGGTIAQLHDEHHPIFEDIPSPLEYLTTPSRKYFKEILELLEHADIPFELSDKLYADPNVYSHTIFEIVEENSEDEHPVALARGGRYDALTRPYTRSTTPSTGIVIAARTKGARSSVGKPRRRKPKACLIHIGREASIQSINIIETFRKQKIPIEQCLYFDRFSEQMAHAESCNAKHIIIMGQKEARDGVVMIRNTDDRSQKTIPIEQLSDIVKAL